MLFAVLILFIIILFVVGISFVYSGGWNTQPAGVNPAELEKKEEKIALAKSAEAKAASELTLAQQELVEAKQSLEDTKGLEEKVSLLETKEKAAKTEVEKINSKVQAVYMKADTQAKDALEVIESLRKESQELSQRMEELQSAQVDPEEIKQMETENQNLKTQIDEVQAQLSSAQEEADKTIEELREQLSQSSESGGDPAGSEEAQKELGAAKEEYEQKLKETKENLEDLKAENQALRAQLEQDGGIPISDEDLEKMKQMTDDEKVQSEAVIENLKFENAELQKQVDESMGKMQNLKEEILRLKGSEEGAAAVSVADAPGSDPEAENLKALCDDFRQQLDNMKSTVTALQSDNAQKSSQPSQDLSDLHERLNKMKELNTFLIEKEKLMQLELTKSRVQALGLSKICEDFKLQVDKMSKKS